MNCENRLFGKIAFITGATSGIGKSTAIAFAKEGVNLILTARRENLLLELKTFLEKEYHIQVFTLRLDVRNAEDVKRSIEMYLSLGEISKFW